MSVLYITNDALTDGVVNSYYYGAISFEQVTVPIVFGYDHSENVYLFGPPQETDLALNGDQFVANGFILSPQDDVFGLVEDLPANAIHGGDGNDRISNSFYNLGIYMTGDNGDDQLYGGAPNRDNMLGGAGNDVLTANGPDEMTGGTGADRFIIAPLNSDLNIVKGSVFITDLQAGGAYHDYVELWDLLRGGGYTYDSFTDAMDAGTLGVRYQNGYTLLTYDSDHDQVPDFQIAHIKGIVMPDQYNSTFVVAYKDTYAGLHGEGDDVLDGTANPLRDHLLGYGGNDVLIMGDTDEATGGHGHDRFVITSMTGSSAFITDLQPTGFESDVVDLWKPLQEAGHDYGSFTEAQADGTLGISYRNGYSFLSYDTDGDHVPDHQFAHVKGVVPTHLIDQVYLVSSQNSFLA